MIIVICILTITLGVAMTVGYTGYLAFGASTKSVILYNLPNQDPISIIAKFCYVLTICGSFVIIVQPIFGLLERANWYKSMCRSTPEEEEKPKEDAMMPTPNKEDMETPESPVIKDR
jgi:amino acid permease